MAVAALVAATASAVQPAAAADDLKRSKCVDTKDIDKNAVKKNRIEKVTIECFDISQSDPRVLFDPSKIRT